MITLNKEDVKKALQYNTVMMHEHTNPHHVDNGIFLLDALNCIDDIRPLNTTSHWEEIEYTSISGGEVISTPSVRCANCKKSDARWYNEMKYCPNCGAKMEEK